MALTVLHKTLLLLYRLMLARACLLVAVCCLSFAAQADAQILRGKLYSVHDLSQEPARVVSLPEAVGIDEKGDTSFTHYGSCSVNMKTYFVHGDQYDNVFNPNPTGIFLNGQHFNFFCGIEKAFRQNASNFLRAEEFEYLGRRYLMLINYREDCLGAGCRYRCYNLFDITNKRRITQHSFSSIFEGTDSFGEFNNDGELDFVRLAPKPGAPPGEEDRHYVITAYTIPDGAAAAEQLTNSSGHAYYIYAKGDDQANNFQIVQADWFFALRDTSGQVARNVPYFPPYISFDPFYQYLYDPSGVRIEKNRWSIRVRGFGDLEAAKDFCFRMKRKNFHDVFIMVDQYNNDITFQIFMGNFVSKERALQYLRMLSQRGIQGELSDLQGGF